VVEARGVCMHSHVLRYMMIVLKLFVDCGSGDGSLNPYSTFVGAVQSKSCKPQIK
jgi:hypothetical protein